MRYVEFRGRVYALFQEDVIENVGSPDDLAYAMYSSMGCFSSIIVNGCDLKDCKNCNNYHNGIEPDICDCVHDPTNAYDKRFCNGFEWREY